MPKKIAILADISNLYYCIKRKFDRKLDYQAYIDFIKPLGDIVICRAYGSKAQEAKKFDYYLSKLGFDVHRKLPKIFADGTSKADWDMEIAMDMVDIATEAEIDLLILGSADGDMAPAVKYVQERGIECLVLACGVSRDLKISAKRYGEIFESMLEKKCIPTKQK